MLGEKFRETSVANACRNAGPIQQIHDVLALATCIQPWSPALQAAVQIAARWAGNVTACYVPGSLREQRSYEFDPTVMSLLMEAEDTCTDEAAAFHAYAADQGVRHTAWTVTHTAIAPTLRNLGSWHDLAVLERDVVSETHIFDILGEAMLCSHVPCLVLPPGWDRSLSFDRIVIGWNGSIEATRTLHSALPLLQLANEVIFVNGDVRSASHPPASVPEPDPVVYLRHHGINVMPRHVSVPADEAGGMLLEKAHRARADLLVMGAYGHSRIRERVLGGATRHVIAQADLPVFMQH